MEKVRYEEMLPHEIVKRRKNFPAAFIGLGGLEWHGEHLAVGNDALKAEKLCQLAAQYSGGFAFPTLWYGEPRNTALLETTSGDVRLKMGFKDKKFSESYFGRTTDQQTEFYCQLIYHVLIQMNTLEMKAVCFVCGHYPLHRWVLPAVEKFNKEFKDTQAFAGIEFHYPVAAHNINLQEISPARDKFLAKHKTLWGGDHAAKWETSYLWYLRPDCVDMSIYLNREDEPLIGVGGIDPRKEASIERGRNACDLIVEGMIVKARELIKKTSV